MSLSASFAIIDAGDVDIDFLIVNFHHNKIGNICSCEVVLMSFKHSNYFHNGLNALFLKHEIISFCANRSQLLLLVWSSSCMPLNLLLLLSFSSFLLSFIHERHWFGNHWSLIIDKHQELLSLIQPLVPVARNQDWWKDFRLFVCVIIVSLLIVVTCWIIATLIQHGFTVFNPVNSSI